jgi:hypothetical protein
MMPEHVWLTAKYIKGSGEYLMTSAVLFYEEKNAIAKVNLENEISADDKYVWDYEVMFIH